MRSDEGGGGRVDEVVGDIRRGGMYTEFLVQSVKNGNHLGGLGGDGCIMGLVKRSYYYGCVGWLQLAQD